MYQIKDKPSITFHIPQNQDDKSKAKKQQPWKVVLQMDQNVQELQARTSDASMTIGKKHALKKYDQFALYTSCFWGKYLIKYYPSCEIS